MTETPTDQEALREQVRARYAQAADAVRAATHDAGDHAVDVAGAAGCCGPGAVLEVDERFGAGLYDDGTTGGLPAEAVLASLGCGNPTAVADLQEGERVLELARRNAAEAGATNVAFLQGTIEDLPLPDASVDVVISNCVVNLSTDKPAVLAETFRVLVPGGRIGISDVVAEDSVTPAERTERGSYVGCIAGALSRTEYLNGLSAAGFSDATVSFTHEVAPGLHGAIVRATKPATTRATEPTGVVETGPGVRA
jgi:SAM-dependent methyltransferase